MHSVTLLSILICVLSVCSIARADFQCYPSDCCPQFRQFDGTTYYPVQNTAPGTVCKGGQQVLPSQCTTPCASNPSSTQTPTVAPATTSPTVTPATQAPVTPATQAPTLAPAVPFSGSCAASVLLAKTSAWGTTQQYALTVVNNGKCGITSALVTFAMASDSQIDPGFWGMTGSGSSYAVTLYGDLAASQSVSNVGFSMQYTSSPAISASVAVTCSSACSSGASTSAPAATATPTTAPAATASPTTAPAATASPTTAPAATAAPTTAPYVATIAPTTAPAPPVQPIQKITPGALNYPLKVVYVDYMIDWNNPQNTILSAVASGYNVVVMGFYITGGTVADMAYSWAALSEETRIATMNTVHAAGAVVLISLGGATDGQWISDDPVLTGTTIGNWAKKYHLDGVDLDLEYSGTFAAVRSSESATVAQFASIITATRAAYGSSCIISIAPVAPWFGPVGMPKCTSNGQTGCSWVGPTGGMTGLYKQVENQIDFFFVQFYNQGQCYTTQAGLMTQSSAACDLDNWFPYTSVAEIVAQGVPSKKLVVGKPVNQGAASSGLVAPALLSSWLAGSKVGGTGIWMWDSAAGTGAKAWVAAVSANQAVW